MHHINRHFMVVPKRTDLRTLSHSDELYILGLITGSPSHYLSELCHAIEDVCGMSVSLSAVCKIIDKHTCSFTRKYRLHTEV